MSLLRLGPATKLKRVSPGLSVELWKNQEELNKRIDDHLLKLISDNLSASEPSDNLDKVKGLNLIFGLYPNGHVKKNFILKSE